MFHKGIQCALEKLGKSKFGFESTTASNFKSKRHEGSGYELVDYSRAPCLCADQKARGLWERDFGKRAFSVNFQFRGVARKKGGGWRLHTKCVGMCVEKLKQPLKETNLNNTQTAVTNMTKQRMLYNFD